MFVDASALTAILTEESDARELLARLQNGRTRVTSPLAVWDAVVAVARILGLGIGAASEAVEGFLTPAEIDVLTAGPDVCHLAIARPEERRVGKEGVRTSRHGGY